MKTKLSILLLYLSFAVLIQAKPRSYLLSLESGEIVISRPTNAVELSIEETTDGISVEYSLKYVNVQADDLFTGQNIIHIDGFGIDDQPGHPAIPLRNDLFTIPKNCEIELVVKNVEFKEFNYSIGPARQSLSDNVYNMHTTDNISPIEPYIGFFPEAYVELSDKHAEFDCDLQYVRINPVRYDMFNHKIQVLTKINYQVRIVSPNIHVTMPNQIK